MQSLALRHCSSTQLDLASLEKVGIDTMQQMEEAVEVLIRGVGEDLTREGLLNTPKVSLQHPHSHGVCVLVQPHPYPN